MDCPRRRSRSIARARRAAMALLAALLLPLLSGCSSWGFPGVYRINVEQGNIVTREMIDQLEPGMNRHQVRYILGTPLIEDPFNPQRWEYLYSLRNGDKLLLELRLTVYFDGDTLTHFDSTLPPSSEKEEAPEATGDAEEPDQGDA